jgi:hypothetical protein
MSTIRAMCPHCISAIASTDRNDGVDGVDGHDTLSAADQHTEPARERRKVRCRSRRG